VTKTEGSAETIPPKWTRKKLKYLASLRSGDAITAESISEAGEYPVYGGNGLRGFTSGFTHSGSFVLIGRQGALCGCINYASGRFWASEHAVVVDTGGRFNVRWLGEILRSLDLNQYSQSAAQPGLAVDTIANLSVPEPPEAEQNAIGAFVERQSAKINALVEKKERLITLLEEKRAALINRAVTKGLDPSAPMKTSGILWLGSVPAHWQVKRLKNISVGGLTNGIFKTKDAYGDGTPLINVVDVYQSDHRICFDNLDRVRAIPTEAEKYRVSAGDILFVRSSLKLEGTGASALVDHVPEPTVFECHLVRLRPDPCLAVPGFLSLYLNSALVRQRTVAIAQTTTMSTIGQNELACLPVVLPPPPEQGRICAAIDADSQRIDAAILKIREQIAKFHEYRTALISAAVTGKIDVRECGAASAEFDKRSQVDEH